MALVHFVWQGLLIGAVLSIGLKYMHRHSPNARYALCLAGMITLLAAPLITTLFILRAVSPGWGITARGPLDVGDPVLAFHSLAPILPWLTGLWIAGAFSLHVRLIINLIYADRIRRSGLSPGPAFWQKDLDPLRERLGIGRVVRLMESTRITAPSVIGWLKPVILLPVGIAESLTPPQIRAILAHELAHVRRYDYIVNLMQSVFESLLFFHPVTWWLSKRLRTEREFCCDDVALSVVGGALHYARALATLEELRDREIETSIASTGGSLMKRLVRIFDSTDSPSTGTAKWLVPLAGLSAIAAITVMVSIGCQTESESQAIAAPADPEIEQVGSAMNTDTDIRQTIEFSLQQAAENGILTEEQANCAVAALDEAHLTCGEGLQTILEEGDLQPCIIATAIDCCPDGQMPEGCRDGMDVKVIHMQGNQGRTFPPDCCPDGQMPEGCCKSMDVKVIPIQGSDGQTGEICIGLIEEQ